MSGFAYKPLKVIQGSFHQADLRFGYTAGIQCSCNSIISICYAKFRKISLWKYHDLDYILEQGDANFKQLGFKEMPYTDEFPRELNLENNLCFVKSFVCHDGEFVSDDAAINFVSKELLQGNCGAIVIINGYSIAIMYQKEKIFVFDSHSRDSCGNIVSNGTSTLMQFLSLQQVRCYIQQTYKTNFFQVLYVKISFQNFDSMKAELMKCVVNRQKCISKYKLREARSGSSLNKNVNIGMEKNDAVNTTTKKTKRNYEEMISSEKYEIRKAKMRKVSKDHFDKMRGSEKHETIKAKKRKASKDSFDEVRGTKKHETLKAKMRKASKDSLNEIRGTKKHETIKAKWRKASNDHFNKIRGTKKHEKIKAKMRKVRRKYSNTHDRVQAFETIIQQGPYYICVCCNRCLYKRSTLLFAREKYPINTENIIANAVKSFDGNVYICLTCHRYLLKKKVPCQSVSNKLELFDFPNSLRDIRKLERILISQRILFSKIMIMHKGEFPKLRGAICNIPNPNPDVCTVLPRGSDSSGVVNVELKRKLAYRFPVISQQVRPEKIALWLNFLVSHNYLYKDVIISDDLFDGSVEENISDKFDSDTSIFDAQVQKQTKKVILKFVDERFLTMIQPYEEDESEYDVEDPLNSFRTPASETLLVSEIPNVLVDDENIILAPGEGQTPNSLTNDQFCEELAHPHLFPTGNFGYKVDRDIKLSPTKYFNQRLLNYTQRFASDADYIFFAHKVLLELNLRGRINIALKKVTCANLTAGMLGENFSETVKNCVASDNAYKFMNQIKGTPAYWQHMLSDVLAMVKQLGIPTYFMTLSCADLHWNELVMIIRRLKGENCTVNVVAELDYESRCKELNSNPVLLARHFQYRVENFFKLIVMNGQLGKILYYCIRVEFQARGSPHVHCLLWAENAPTLSENTKEDYIRHVDSVMSANIPDANDNVKLRGLVQKYQTHSHSKTCKKYNKNECRFGFGKLFCKRTIISEPLCDDSLCEVEKHALLVKRNDALQKVQNYIDENLHPRKQNILDPSQLNFVEIPSMDEILNTLGLGYDEYEYYLSISPDNDRHLHLKRDPNSCFVNNYFSEGLLSWQANIDIQPV